MISWVRVNNYLWGSGPMELLFRNLVSQRRGSNTRASDKISMTNLWFLRPLSNDRARVPCTACQFKSVATESSMISRIKFVATIKPNAMEKNKFKHPPNKPCEITWKSTHGPTFVQFRFPGADGMFRKIRFLTTLTPRWRPAAGLGQQSGPLQ